MIYRIIKPIKVRNMHQISQNNLDFEYIYIYIYILCVDYK